MAKQYIDVLIDGKVYSLGGSETKRTNVKIIAATNVEPLEAIEKGQLRRDIYYRLSMMSIRIPPLRERKADIGHFVKFYVNKHNGTFHKQVQYVSKDLLKKLEEYDWPGNVRELETVLERAVALAEGDVIGLSDLHARISAAEVSAPTGKPLPGHEAKRLLAALERTAGNVREAAKLLGISRGGFYVKLKKLGLNPDEYR